MWNSAVTSDSVLQMILPYLCNVEEEKVIKETSSSKNALANANMEISGGKKNYMLK